MTNHPSFLRPQSIFASKGDFKDEQNPHPPHFESFPMLLKGSFHRVEYPHVACHSKNNHVEWPGYEHERFSFVNDVEKNHFLLV